MTLDRAPAHLADMPGFVRESGAERAAIGGVPWRQIIGLRNIAAHGCGRIGQETLYRTAATDLATVEQSR
ncbi:MAG TPA: DUF86 domain-containing protein [Rubrivivax sp.]|nr:DUF86 domain-containing protein [Rubrivivax sp.]